MAWGESAASEQEAIGIARRAEEDLRVARHRAAYGAMMEAAAQASSLVNRDAAALRSRRETEAAIAVLSAMRSWAGG